ncbi:MAG TPA: adenylate/guanylate cyclase domain-containing protein [Gammaproteobacteria bacterium]
MTARGGSLLVGGALCLLAAALAWLGTRHVPLLREGTAWLEDLELAYFGPSGPQSERVVLVTIDEELLAELPFRSPISRALLTDILQALAAKGPAAVVIDLLFDQATVAEDDAALLRAMAEFPAPVVVAAGDAASGMTARQLEFQHRYLYGLRVGAAAVHTVDGVVRYLHPEEGDGPERMPSFVAAAAEALGVAPPAAPARIYYRARADDGLPPIRAFPARGVEHLPRAWIEGRVVVLGADLPNQDRFRTPLSVLGGTSSTMAGVQIHAQALAQWLDGRRYPEAPWWLEAGLLLTAALLGFGLPFLDWSAGAKVALAAAGVALYWALGVAWFAAAGPQLPLLPPTAALLLAVSFGTAYARHGDRAEKRFVREAFQRYVSPTVIEHVLRDPGKLELGGEKREMSFLFSDLADFTSFAERNAPDAVVALLQEYFEGMLRIALDHGGTVDRLLGDSIAVFFNAPAAQPDHAARAVRCALALDRFCQAFRARRGAHGLPVGVTRIGVHTGTAIVGNVGSATRFHYTAHGDCVNTAARLEGVNKHLGTRVCVSLEAARHCPEELFRPVGTLVLKGRSAGLECVTPCDETTRHIRDDYLAAYAALARHDPRAAELFAALSRSAPDDPLIAFHRQRLQRGETGVRVVLEEK